MDGSTTARELEERFDRHERSVRVRTAAFSIVPVVIAGIFLWWTLLEIDAAQSRRDEVLADLKNAEVSKVRAEEQARALSDRVDEYRAKISTSAGNLEKVTEELKFATRELDAIRNPPLSSIEPQAQKVKLAKKFVTSGGSTYFDFSLWLKMPDGLKKKIEKVEYYFDHPTFQIKRKTSNNPSNAYAVSYIAYACITEVTITIWLEDGRKRAIEFDLCEYLALNAVGGPI